MAMGVSSAARACQSGLPVAVAMSMALAQLSAMERAAKISARMLASIRRTSAWSMIVPFPLIGVAPCRRSIA